MKANRLAGIIGATVVARAITITTSAAQLPEHYFQLIERELASLASDGLKPNAGAKLAAAVSHAKRHTANPAYGDMAKLKVALELESVAVAEYSGPRTDGCISENSYTSTYEVSGITQLKCNNTASKSRMAPSEEIPRADWLAETQRFCASDTACDAYVALERYVVEKTTLLSTYRRNQHGKSNFATFCGSALGHCSVIQIYNGRCWINWKWTPDKSGRTAKQIESINRAFEELRSSLDGSKTKGWEQVKVVRLGLDRVKSALLKASVELNEALNDNGQVAASSPAAVQ